MAPENQYFFNHKDLVTQMIRSLDIHEGLWTLAIQFGLMATNVSEQEDGSEAIPAAITSIGAIGIQRTAELVSGCVDAAIVNPVQ